MNILIVGTGGREHAIAWKINQSEKVKNIFVAPGNAGTACIARNIDIRESAAIAEWASQNKMDLVVVGPDNYLAEGLVDMLEAVGVPVFGPTCAAAEIEWSKAFAKRFMKEEGIPTAEFETFSDLEKAKEYIAEANRSFPTVIKASGLALGKGVVIAHDRAEAHKALDEMMRDKIFGNAGSEVIIEEFMQGREISTHAFCDGDHAVLFPSAQDHKRIFDGDKGPNTGGMGTLAPVPGVSEAEMKEVLDQIVMPTIKALKRRGKPFKGVLFPGIIFTDSGPKVIEFNARFGDPETQSYMRILETDLVDILQSCVAGTIREQQISWAEKSACCIVAASDGYPGVYEKGKRIHGIETFSAISNQNQNVGHAIVFHAATKLEGDACVTDGGRVLGVTAIANDLGSALDEAYRAIEHISFDGMQYRKDIGTKFL